MDVRVGLLRASQSRQFENWLRHPLITIKMQIFDAYSLSGLNIWGNYRVRSWLFLTEMSISVMVQGVFWLENFPGLAQA
jgi:hypothetical protein